jgi:molecular chaperone HtpG
MEIIINSLYSNRDVFLRELASNAADACDKKRFLSLTGAGDGEACSANPEIRIKGDPDAKTITIEDSGVGMTREELINNLGKIAQSGTKKFLEALGDSKSADVNLIGQFGVGFYSGYLVADKITVVSKSMVEGSPQLKWESQAGSSFTIADDSDSDEPMEGGSGTRITLHLKEDALEYADPTKLQTLLEHYSEFVEFPIKVWKETTEYKQVPDVEANAELKEDEEPKMKTIPETTEGYSTLNTQKPIWLRSPREVTDEEYTDFYKAAFKAQYDEPMKWNHFVLEGQVECKSILYIPGMLPFELSKDMFDEDSRNVRLYVKRVFINDKFDELMPRWLKFVRGVVDSNDLQLNVSREILQKTKVLNVINKRLVRKSLDMVRDIMEDDENDEEEGPSKYTTFWNNFGKYVKVGVIEDEVYKNDLGPLLRFYSSHSEEEYTSLDSYVERMAEGQKKIYYLAGEGKANVKMSPVIEKLKNKGYEVLFMVEPLDEICAQSLRKFKDFDLVDAAKSGLDLQDESTGEDAEEKKAKQEQLDTKFKSVIDYLEVELKGKVQKVQVSDLLSTSPGAIVQGEYGLSPSMQRYMKAQSVAMGEADFGMNANMNQAVLEINPTHPIVTSLSAMVEADSEGEDTKNFAVLLYDVAAMTSGYEVENPADFAQRVVNLMNVKSGADSSTPGVSDAQVTSESKDTTDSSSSSTSSDASADEDEDDDGEEAKVAEVVG